MSSFFSKTLSRRLISVMLFISIIPLLILGYLSITYTQEALKKAALDKLKAVETLKENQIIRYFNERIGDVKVLGGMSVIDDLFVEKSSNRALPDNMQENKIANNKLEEQLNFLETYRQTYGYSNIILLNAKSEVILDSVSEKREGQNILGKFKNSNLGKLIKLVIDNKRIVLTDLAVCPYADNKMAMYIGTPYYNKNKIFSGIVVAQIFIHSIDSIMHETTGLGSSGESYLVGPDFLMRSNSRFDKAGQSSILDRKVETKAVAEALQNKAASDVILDYRGIEVLSSYSMLDFDTEFKDAICNFNWAIIAEIDTDEAFANAYHLRTLLISIIGVIIVLVLIIAIFLARTISKPLIKTAKIANKIADNDLDIEFDLDEKREDEIGSLGNALDSMVTNLKTSLLETNQKIENLNSLPTPVLTIDNDFNVTYINNAAVNLTECDKEKAVGQKCYELFKTHDCKTEKCACAQAIKSDDIITEETIAKPTDTEIDIRYTGAPIKDASGNIIGALEFILDVSDEKTLSKTITEGADKLGSAITEITATITQLAANTTETSSAIDEITTTVTEVRQVSETAHERAVEVTENAEQVNAIADEGKGATEDTVDGIMKIKEEMSSIAESTIKLGEQTQNIGEIISSVNSLADQSNLLSVNASIEAAKAGEFGKGFAVVAREVKALAEQSKSATKQINSILTDIQKATSSAVMATERGTNAVSSGQELSNAAGDSITKLAASIQESAESALQIAASSQQQLAGMDQLTKAMESITTATKQNLTGTQQLEQASMQMGKLANDLKDSIKTLGK